MLSAEFFFIMKTLNAGYILQTLGVQARVQNGAKTGHNLEMQRPIKYYFLKKFKLVSGNYKKKKYYLCISIYWVFVC